MTAFDVVVVGARCAGAPLATLLARAGLRVCVVDRAHLPSDTPSTHGIQPCGVMALERFGVLPALLDLAAPIERGTMVLDDARIEFSLPDITGAPMLNVRRITLDRILLEAATDAGVDVRERTAVTALLLDDGRVAGVQTTRGDIRARLVVGADGVRSTVARLVGAAEYAHAPASRVFLWGYFHGVAAEAGRMWIGKVGDHVYLANPTDRGAFMAATGVSLNRRDEVLRDREGVFGASMAEWPELADRLAGARREGALRVLSPSHGFFRESAGPGWVLVGDAGHFKDPSPGQGISDAFRQVERLAPAIEAGTDRALEDWWAWRDRDAWEMHWFAQDTGAAGPTPPLIAAMQGRMARDPELTRRFLRVLNHDLAPSAVFTPALALKVTARAVAEGRGRRRALLREAGGLVATEVRRRPGGPAARPS
jgi:2-polyprenyl-6-methoxyphenol hydroxylase-like FAD-dependent oxidoreductase